MNCKKNVFYPLCLMLAVLCTFLFYSCAYGLEQFLYRPDDVASRSKKIRDVTPPGIPSSNPYTFIVVTDMHYGAGKKRFDEKFLKRIEELLPTPQKPVCILVLGDIADHGKKEEFKQYEAFTEKIAAKGVPVYGVVGNHDLYNSGWKHWRTHVKPYFSYYRFNAGGFSWYVIDSGNGVLGEPQLQNLVSEMEKDPSPKFVFSHYALYGGGIPYFVMSDTRERAILIDTFSNNNVKIMFSGHYHPGRPLYKYGNFSELVLRSFIDFGSWVEVTVNNNGRSVSWREY